MALRRSVVLRLSPDERGPFPQYGGRQFVPPPPTGSNYYGVTRYSSPIPNPTANTEAFVLEHDRTRMKYFLEHRHLFLFHTRKVPEFWKSYRFYYKLGESLQEWRENRVRQRIEELFTNDAVQCTVTEAFEVKRVADRLVTLIKDGSRSSRRILQEFFEVKNWDGGRRPNTWSGVGEAGDMRALYKALDDFPQRFKNRQGNYTLMTPTHTPTIRQGGPFLDPDQNRMLLRRVGDIAIVEMKDRDLSIFHRGQLVTGDKGADVWDHDKDRPLLDTHRGFDEQPIGLQVDDEIREKEERERKSRGVEGDFVTDPSQYVGYQKISDMEYEDRVPDKRKTTYNRLGFHRAAFGKNTANKEELEEWPADLEEIEQYIKTMRFNATKRQLYKSENFYKMFPTIGEAAWVEKMYKPYMKMTPERQAQVYQVLENVNIHNMSKTTLTEGLPFPKVLEENFLQDHYRKTWKNKLEFLESFPHTDPRDREFLCAAQKDALEGKLNEKKDDVAS
eukprot:TRINITY_DN1809_c1_g1_i4.p1 TRINITY_DN1809_c1_g1~~TRINITY_DN1809_c1_g1_i4.p1  ORF type:complete len:503 (+),score=111.26 TRINITY_DN1809_c1_g1_i4:42-1550(+)